MAAITYMYNGLVFNKGQRVTANWGACYPTEEGKIVDFITKPASRFSPASVLVVIEWSDGRQSKEEISRIHEPGYRSENGSPIGIFTA